MIHTAAPESTALADRLLELAAAIDLLDDMSYGTTRADGVSGSIGAHARHTIDHVAALIDGAGSAIDYDTRRRGTEVERSRRAASDELVRLAAALQQWSPERLAREVTVDAVVHPDGRRTKMTSTVGREMVFVLSHTIHHQAIIALLLAASGRTTPERFGLAPSTPSRAICARSA